MKSLGSCRVLPEPQLMCFWPASKHPASFSVPSSSAELPTQFGHYPKSFSKAWPFFAWMNATVPHPSDQVEGFQPLEAAHHTAAEH